ncbi:MAG TPA: hypothetical protein VIU85_00215 [Chthoniobacterales bacterium]
MRSLQVFLLVTGPFLLFACAGSPHPQPVSPSEGSVGTPRYLELDSTKQVATLHFPAGVYALSAVDKIGYYYRAPRKIGERVGSRSVGLDGGIFVSKRDPQKLRGYVYRAGAITHVGNFSHAKHRLFDQDIPADPGR